MAASSKRATTKQAWDSGTQKDLLELPFRGDEQFTKYFQKHPIETEHGISELRDQFFLLMNSKVHVSDGWAKWRASEISDLRQRILRGLRVGLRREFESKGADLRCSDDNLVHDIGLGFRLIPSRPRKESGSASVSALFIECCTPSVRDGVINVLSQNNRAPERYINRI